MRTNNISATLVNNDDIVVAEQITRKGDAFIIFICAKRRIVIPNNTNLGYVKAEEEEVENLVQALINFADLDTPLENPSATTEREPNWRKKEEISPWSQMPTIVVEDTGGVGEEKK